MDKAQALITEFIDFYRVAMSGVLASSIFNLEECLPIDLRERLRLHPIDDQHLLYQLNTGDCGVAAVAIGAVLEVRGGGVTFCDNGNHAYFQYGNKYYDTLNPEGISDPKLLYGHWESSEGAKFNFRKMYGHWISMNYFDHVLVASFYERQLKCSFPYPPPDSQYMAVIPDNHPLTLLNWNPAEYS